jgi:hypothetical protein
MQYLADRRERCDKDQIMPFHLKRVLSIFLLTLAFLAFSVSCGNRARATPTQFSFAYVEDACGPTDGLAIEFFFTQKQAQCGKFEEPFILIEIDENLPKSWPQDYSIMSGRSAVLASRCMSHGKCESATSGTLHLAKFSHGSGASGAYELRFNDGSIEKGSFDARWCVTKLLCG